MFLKLVGECVERSQKNKGKAKRGQNDVSYEYEKINRTHRTHIHFLRFTEMSITIQVAKDRRRRCEMV